MKQIEKDNESDTENSNASGRNESQYLFQG